MSPRPSLTLSGLILVVQIFGQTPTQNNILRGRILYQSSGNKPAVGAQIKEKDSNGDYSKNNGEYRLVFQSKRNGAALQIELAADMPAGKKIELVNEKEVKAAKLPASADEMLDIIVCPAGQRDIAAQKYYRILRTAADRELEKKKKEVDALLAQKDKDYQQISALFAQLDAMQAALDSAKIREQAFSIASINLDRASKLVQEAVKKIEEENDVAGALKILSTDALDTAYHRASALKKKAEQEIRQVIEGYEFRVSLLDQQFKYGEIAQCYEKIREIYEKEDYDKTQMIAYLSLAASFSGDHGDFQKQLDYNLKVLDFREKNLQPDDTLFATTFNNLAFTYGHLGQHKKAMEFNLKALAIWEKTLPIDSIKLAASYNNLAGTYGNLGEYQKALEFNLKTLAIQEKILSPNDSYLAMSYNNLSTAYNNLGDHKKALDYSLKALGIREKILPADHPDIAQSYHNLATIYGDLADFQKELEFNLKSVTIFEKILPAVHPDFVSAYSNLAYAYGHLGDFQKELEFNLKAMAIAEKTLPPQHPLLALSYNNLSTVYSRLREHQKALEFSLKVLAIFEEALPPNHPHLATTYHNTGVNYRNVGEYEKGIEYGKKSVDAGEATNPKHPGLSRFYTNLAISHLKALQFPEAKNCLEKGGNLKADERVFRGWTMYYALQNDKEKAIESLQQAVTLGLKDLNWLETEPILESIRDEQGYKNVVEQLQKK